MSLPPSLFELLSNSLILYQTVAYIPVSSLLALGATSHTIRSLIHGTPGVFSRMDLTNISAAQFELAAIDHGGELWRNVQLDENVTEDDFYGGPLRGIFSKIRKQNILQEVHTLILDGLSVTSDLVSEIILSNLFSVKVLSVRGVQNLNERKVQQALQYAVRPGRPEGFPKLQAMYIFGPRDSPPTSLRQRCDSNNSSQTVGVPFTGFGGSIMHAPGAQIGADLDLLSSDTSSAGSLEKEDKWYSGRGKVYTKPFYAGWENTMQDCLGIISFDAVICRGPRHTAYSNTSMRTNKPWYTSQSEFLSPRAATCSVAGCSGCGTSPEGFATFGKSPLHQFPLLAPPPVHASSIQACKQPFHLATNKQFLARCTDCLRARFCESCYKWWCEDCYEIPGTSASTRSLLTDSSAQADHVKVHMGLCVENCLAPSMMAGAGSNGMWG